MPVGAAHYEDELPEVLVECNEDPIIIDASPEDFIIPRVGLPVADVVNIVSGRAELVRSRRPDAGIQEQTHHRLPAMTGSTRSCPTARRA